jgi:hypothetical protein
VIDAGLAETGRAESSGSRRRFTLRSAGAGRQFARVGLAEGDHVAISRLEAISCVWGGVENA